MSKTQKLFRYLWRINAVIILLAAGAVAAAVGVLVLDELGRKAQRYREPEEIPIATSARNARLSLARATLVPGTKTLRAELQANSEGGKFSSGYGTETRNILFIEPGEKAGRWLLPDNEHVLTDTTNVTEEKSGDTKRLIATTALIKPAQESPGEVNNKLVVFDPTGRKIVEVANNVKDIHFTSFTDGELTVLYERDRKLFRAAFDPGTLAKLREQEIEIPQLK